MESDMLHQNSFALQFSFTQIILFCYGILFFFFSILSIFTAFKPFILQPNELNVLKKGRSY